MYSNLKRMHTFASGNSSKQQLNKIYMRKVLVSFEVFVSQSKEHPLVIVNPDFVFSGEFDLSDDNSHRDLCEMEYRVECVCDGLKALGCQVAAIRKEVSHLDIK